MKTLLHITSTPKPICRHILRTALAAASLCAVLAVQAEDKPAAASARKTTTPAPSARTSPVLPAPEPGSALAELIKRGATMEEIAQVRDPIATNPKDAIDALKRGNARFFGGSAARPEQSAMERRAQILSQTPFATILGCSDSRVPTEIVYDQGLGSLFIVRVAGNVTVPATEGSIEYAVTHLKTQVVVVMGHEGCGAVKAAMLPKAVWQAESENIRYLVGQIAPAVSALPPIRDAKSKLREAVIANVRVQTHRMKENPVIAAAIKAGKIAVIGAYYEIGSGAVDFLETDEDLRLSPEELERLAQGVRENAAAHHPAPAGSAAPAR